MPAFRPPFDRELRDLRRRQIRRILRRPWSSVPSARRSLDLLRACLERDDEPGRRRLYDSPALGGWIHDVLLWASVRDLTETIRSGRPSRQTENLLFERIARTEYLVELVPAGRLDPGFAARVRKRALRVLWERMTDLPRILLPHFPPTRDRVEIPLFFRELPEEGCPVGKIRLGESPVWIAWKKGPPPMALKTVLVGGSLVISGPVVVEPHETIPGTRILLAHRLVSGPQRLRVGGPVPGLAARLARALAFVGKAWPRAAEEIRERTWMVVPLVEPGTVSYSQMSRPGVSYINIFRGSLLDLGDDLLHETAHHRLHARQEVEPLLRDPGEPLYFSPWRRSFRPLNGILHGTYTFLYRAELYLRLLRRETRRKGLEEEAARELVRCRISLADLEKAADQGLLTEAGRSLVARMQRRYVILSRRRLSLKGLSGIL